MCNPLILMAVFVAGETTVCVIDLTEEGRLRINLLIC